MARGRRAGSFAALLLLVPLTAGCVAGPDRRVPASHPAPLNSASNRVGAMFLGQLNGPRMCTASVVASPHRNLLVTAAHCVTTAEHSTYDGLVFAPGYRDGKAPYDVWPVTSVTVDPRWLDNEDPEYDVAFLTVDTLRGRQIEDVLGGNPLGDYEGFGLPVSVTGYPNESTQPITCRTVTTMQSSTQQRFDCTGYTDGTSGSPWLTQSGSVIGVIGGYQQGGDSDDVSYSITFDDRVSALYQKATA